jgi:lipopolysaccharide transport system permease protein
LALARHDLRNRYRGSVLGPFWLTVSTAVTVAGIGLLYASLFRLPLFEYLPHLLTSLFLWNLLNQAVTEGCQSFIWSEGIIRQMRLPLSVHALRVVVRNALVAAHSLPLVLVVAFWLGGAPGWGVLLAVPGLLLILLNGFLAALLLGMVCARFRDVAQIVASTLQLLFFLTPIIWRPEMLGSAAPWLLLNPAHVLIEVVRAPLLGAGLPATAALAALGWTGLGAGLTLWFFSRFRARLPFWV